MNQTEEFVSTGQFVHDYQIIRKLGKGGEGTVYLVRHCATDQLRAAKCLKFGDGSRLHELNMMKRLRHHSLPEVIDVFSEGECTWLILSYVRGRKLSEAVKEGVKEDQILDWFCQLAEILRYLHHMDPPILHLDIKPTNLIVQKNGTIVLIDFGAAARGHPGVILERSCGTPGFAAPEQYQKNAGIRASADVYAAGAVLNYMIENGLREGKEAFRKKLSRILDRCLAAEAQQRYQEGAELLRDLRRIQKREIRRKRAGTGFGLLLLICLAVTFINGKQKEYQAEKAVTADAEYEKLLSETEKLSWNAAQDRYRQARKLCPGRTEVYSAALERAERDGTFTDQEEDLILELLFEAEEGTSMTGEEILRTQEEEYASFAYQLGLVYWYECDSDGRTAAEEWFRTAVAAAEHVRRSDASSCSWADSAELHLQIAGAYRELANSGGGTEDHIYLKLWENLYHLWNSGKLEEESRFFQEKFAEEILACVIMEAAELKHDGIPEKQIRRTLESIREFLYSGDRMHPEKRKAEQQLQAAREACIRVYQM